MHSKRIKVAMITNSMSINGISAVIMNYCRNLDRSRFQISILAGEPIDSVYADECERNEIEMITLPPRKQDTYHYYRALYHILWKNEFDIVHIHCNSATVTPELLIAWLCGVKIRIAHSHNTTCSNMKIHRAMYPLFRRLYTNGLACGQMAGEWLFRDKKFEVLPNGFQTENFSFDAAERESIRSELHIGHSLVIGHIGRFNGQKNQPYLLRVFEKVAEKRTDAVLLLVGTGPDFEATRAIAEKSRYKDRIILYGTTQNPRAMYSAMDVFVLPSRYEGLPVVLLEAQITGLPCIVSDRVTKEMDFGSICWESIDADPEIWAEKILGTQLLREVDREAYRQAHQNQIAAYDIKSTAKQLDRIYTNLMGKR